MALDLALLKVGDSTFVPYLRIPEILSDAAYQIGHLGINVTYRVTVVEGKYGVLFTRRSDGRTALRNEDTKEN